MGLRENLLEKGWKEDEVERALKVLYSEDAKQAPATKQMNRLLYWATFLIAVIGNIIVSLVLVPFLLVLPHVALYFIVFILGLTFGALFGFLIKDIEHVDPKHHIVAGIFLPAIAIVNITMIVNFANRFSNALKISAIHQNAILTSIFYVVGFMIPYLLPRFIGLLRKK